MKKHNIFKMTEEEFEEYLKSKEFEEFVKSFEEYLKENEMYLEE